MCAGCSRPTIENGYLVNADGRKVILPRGASDAALMSYHVDRSKIFVMERLKGVAQLDEVASRAPSRARAFRSAPPKPTGISAKRPPCCAPPT